jgi:hypothetical protein
MEMKRQIDMPLRQWEVDFFMTGKMSVRYCGKALKESEDTKNVYVYKMRLKRVARGSGRHSSQQGKA